MSSSVVVETNIEELPLFKRGKVRDVYDLGDRLLIVATDRISAFDVVLPNGIPGKGRVLTKMASFWFDLTSKRSPNHLVSTSAGDLPEEVRAKHPELRDRFMIVRKVEPLPVECVVRGYLSGSAWKEYRKSGTVHGEAMPSDLKESDRLETPIFTPTTKAESGHDEPLTYAELVDQVGGETAEALRDKTLDLYTMAFEYAQARGILLADTKLEWGLFDGEMIVIDEIFTPDSSRFWPSSSYAPGGAQPSFDKQFLRDWLEASGWDKTPPAPDLPEDVVRKTGEKYEEAMRLLTES
ncbi:MAG: phosphoribosylaminoimidazolesuccinocarboxamide synthase [Planctomycetota bacterium]|jgi:phosphoribosylaminoimidazole-succinocarboxamide synthase